MRQVVLKLTNLRKKSSPMAWKQADDLSIHIRYLLQSLNMTSVNRNKVSTLIDYFFLRGH